MCFEDEAGNFTLVYSVLLKVGKNVWKMTETLLKNSLLIAKGIWIIHVNSIVIAVTFSEKKIEGLNFVPPLEINLLWPAWRLYVSWNVFMYFTLVTQSVQKILSLWRSPPLWQSAMQIGESLTVLPKFLEWFLLLCAAILGNVAIFRSTILPVADWILNVAIYTASLK
jgi:hypothetical protein